jgi:hypothetical protein
MHPTQFLINSLYMVIYGLYSSMMTEVYNYIQLLITDILDMP